MSATRKGVARKKAARKSKVIKPTTTAAPTRQLAPIAYDQTLWTEMLADIASGAPTRRVIREKGVTGRTFYGTIDANPELAERYTRAKQGGLDALADEIIELADESRIGKKTKETKDGTFDEYGDMVERSRLQIESRKWLLAKLAPKKYGDKVQQEVTGADGGPIQQETKLVCDDQMAALAEKIAALRAA